MTEVTNDNAGALRVRGAGQEVGDRRAGGQAGKMTQVARWMT